MKELDTTFMRDRRNVMLCVEPAADAATMSSLQKCRSLDPKFERTTPALGGVPWISCSSKLH